MNNKGISFFIVIVIVTFFPIFVFSASPKKSSLSHSSVPVPATILSKLPSKVTVKKIKYIGPEPNITVSAIKYTGLNPHIIVSAIKYTGFGIDPSGQSAIESSANKQTKPGNLKPTLLLSARQIYKIGARIPLRVSVAVQTKENLIFEFAQKHKKQWRKIGHQQLGRPKINRNTTKIVSTRYVKLTQPGIYRWRCSANKGKSWSTWSKTLEVVRPIVKKASKSGIREKPVRKRAVDLRED